MSNIELTMTYHVNRPRGARQAYNAHTAVTDMPVTQMQQVGEVWNNRVTYRGIFATKREVVLALLDFVEAPHFKLLDTENGRVWIAPKEAKAELGSRQVLAIKNPNGGVWLAPNL